MPSKEVDADMPIPEEVALILDAVRFAAAKHKGQRRKDEEASPYINHPIQVAHILWHTGGVRDAVTLVAALLHDTLEDTDTSHAEIRAAFGVEVLSLVLEVSDDKGLPKAERKRLQIVHAPGLSERAKALKMADKICNVRDIMEAPPRGWPRERRQDYLDWAGRVVEGLRGINPALEAHFDALLAESLEHLAATEPDAGGKGQPPHA